MGTMSCVLHPMPFSVTLTLLWVEHFSHRKGVYGVNDLTLDSCFSFLEVGRIFLLVRSCSGLLCVAMIKHSLGKKGLI